jgi:hypothetical protein
MLTLYGGPELNSREVRQNLANCKGWPAWRPKSEGFGHAYMIQDMEKEPILQMGSDKMIPKYVYDKPFMIRFPDRSEGFQPDRKG